MSEFVVGSRSRLRSALVLVLSFLLAVTFAVVGSAPAHAAAEVSIDNVYFESDTIADGTRQSLHVDWSIPAKATAPVTLSVDLPAGMVGYGDNFAMKGPGGIDAGQCTVTATTITCTVDDAFIKANPYGVSGSFWFDVKTDLRNDDTTEHTFDFGGTSVPVTVEPNPAYCEENCEFAGYRFKKYGSYNSLDDTITWTVRVPAPATGIPAGSEIVVTDQLDTDIFEMVESHDGEAWPQLWEARCLKINSINEEVPRWTERSTATWNADKTEVSFTSRAGSNTGASCTSVTEGSFYQVVWVVKVKDLGKAGTYENSATYSIDGVTSDPTKGTATRRSGGGDVDGSNFGRFEVTKELDGDTVLNPEFTVNYEAFDDSVDPNTPFETGSFKIRNGQTYTSGDFFDGTRVVLTEVKPTAPANVTWDDPVFIGPDGEPLTELTFTGDRLDTTTQLRLVNKATLKTGEFTFRKAVENPDGAEHTADSYRLNFSRQENAELGITPITGGGVTLTADGTPVSMKLPGATTYSFWENMFQIPAPAGYSWAEPKIVVDGTEVAQFDPVTLPVDGSVEVQVTNRITQDTGGFSIVKSISGEGSSLVPEGTEFTVDYSYTSVNGIPAGTGTVTVVAGADPKVVEGIPAGATVTLNEVRPVDPVGGTWGEPQFDVAEFTALKDQTVPVSLDNPISWNDGDFSVVKIVDGDGADLVGDDTAFGVDYTYELPDALGIEPGTGSGTLTVRNDGTAVTSEPLPYGTTVTLSEQAPAPIAGGTWKGSSFDRSTFTIGDKTTLAVTLTNTIERDPVVPAVGSFSVVKSLAGSGADLVADDAQFTVDYSYPAGDGFPAGKGTLTVRADGKAVSSDDLPAGAEVTLSEATPRAVEGAHWTGASFDRSTFTIGAGTTVAVELTNTIVADEGTPTPTPTPGPVDPDPTDPAPDNESGSGGGTLPATGMDQSVLLLIPGGLALLLIGGLLIAARRRRRV